MKQGKAQTPIDFFSDIRRQADRLQHTDGHSDAPKISIGLATCGIASGALDTKEAFEQELKQQNISASIKTLGCMGHCYAEPYVIIDHPVSGFPPIFYPNITAGKAKMLTRMFIKDGDPRLEHALGSTIENELIPSIDTYSRFRLEKRVVMDRCGRIDPENIWDYIASGGYGALSQALTMDPDAVVDMVSDSGLRGRGGAGFSTGQKWRLAKGAEASHKVVICNADEGDPGAYMDRAILESNPHQVLEGIVICAWAVGADKALIYLRSEYPLAVKTVSKAISDAKKRGLLGRNILKSGFDLDIELFQGAGAFVCGEETALIRSIQGKRGAPVFRPPYPVEKGLFDRPTVINNVKTLSTVAPIIEKGPHWHRSIGTPKSPGTAVFSVVGDVIHPGLVEISMGVTLRELIFDVCGGPPGKSTFKAVQIGGPSGGCLGVDHLDTPVDFEALGKVGAMMGSGGMVVMTDHSCMVDVSRYFLDFTRKESCGKCTFCRIGTQKMHNILERLTKGEAREHDLETLEALALDVKKGSLCGLGKTASNPVLTALAGFKEEFEAHALEKKCPACVCRTLTAFYIELDKCARGCDACVGCCPVEAVFTTSTRKKGIDQSLCVKCGECQVACPEEYDAVKRVSPPDLAPIIERPLEKG